MRNNTANESDEQRAARVERRRLRRLRNDWLYHSERLEAKMTPAEEAAMQRVEDELNGVYEKE